LDLNKQVLYFIIEHIDQLAKLDPSESGFVQVISCNDNYHPKLTKVSLIYYNNFSKGYIFAVDHSESMSLDIGHVISFLSKHNKVYVFDQKYHSYFIDTDNLVDLQFVALNQFGKFEQLDCNTHLQNSFYQKHYSEDTINKLIPISKHYEKCECFYNATKHLIGLESDLQIEKDVVKSYKQVEQNGLKIDVKKFREKYKLQAESFSIKDDIIYGTYNLYNITGRPTNSFNTVNFLAIPKEDGFRDCFIPKNDVFVEFDFDAYHLRLIAKLIGHEFTEDSIHQTLGKYYFSKDDLTEEEYKKSKEITFRQLYGGIEEQYKDIKFFSLLNSFIEKEWEKYNRFRALALPTGRIIKKTEGMNKLRVFNYIVQNMETMHNVSRIQKLHELLKNKKSQLVLITYDSFLFDLSVEDGKQTLESIKSILQEESFIVKHKYGKNYNL
jgi:hypothetical protein